MAISLSQLEIPKATAQAARALQIISAKEPDMQDLEEAIMQDPLLASTMLRYANSPLYHRSQEITNIPTALRLLGLNSVRSAIMMATIRSTLPSDSDIARQIFEHLHLIALYGKLIAQQCCPQKSDDIEFLGLFHDIGMLVLCVNLDADYKDLYEQAIATGTNIDNIEKERFGISHDAVTAHVAHEFRLPAEQQLLAKFHLPERQQQALKNAEPEICILVLAHLLASQSDNASPFTESIELTQEELLAVLQLSEEQIENIQQQAEGVWQEYIAA
ncbi:MAG: HDOD domain-containing protein [Gammaproteobacteria bacterium]|nr:HDOD domain-containing protein [Gammaproteobacteria bacterium]